MSRSGRRVAVLALLAAVGCTAPLVVAEPHASPITVFPEAAPVLPSDDGGESPSVESTPDADDGFANVASAEGGSEMDAGDDGG